MEERGGKRGGGRKDGRGEEKDTPQPEAALVPQ